MTPFGRALRGVAPVAVAPVGGERHASRAREILRAGGLRRGTLLIVVGGPPPAR